MNRRHQLILAATLALAANPAFASGFAFYEQGAKASAQGGAWVARADDASANWYNPAALVQLSGREVQFGLNYLEIGSDTQFSPAPGVSFDAVSNAATPAHFYFSQRINDRVAWGVGLNNPFGLVSEWDTPPVSYFSRRAELRTYLLNPNVAIKISPKWSLAFGVDYLSAEVREFSNDIPGGGTLNLTGEGDAWGYNFALQFKIDHFSLAGQYRSSMNPTVTGDVNGIPAHADLALPGQTMLGAAWISKWVDVELGGYYTQWNYFKTLEVVVGSPLNTTLVQPENWTGTWSYRLGLAFRLESSLKNELRVGYVYDESPIPVEYLRPSIPDANRNGYTLGYGYQSQHWGFDLYGMLLEFNDVTANGLVSDDVINGTYTSSIWLAGVTAKYRF